MKQHSTRRRAVYFLVLVVPQLVGWQIFRLRESGVGETETGDMAGFDVVIYLAVAGFVLAVELLVIAMLELRRRQGP